MTRQTYTQCGPDQISQPSQTYGEKQAEGMGPSLASTSDLPMRWRLDDHKYNGEV